MGTCLWQICGNTASATDIALPANTRNMAKFFKNVITIYTDGPPTREIDALARDAVNGDSFCSDHAITEVSREEIIEKTGDFFIDPEEGTDG